MGKRSQVLEHPVPYGLHLMRLQAKVMVPHMPLLLWRGDVKVKINSSMPAGQLNIVVHALRILK